MNKNIKIAISVILTVALVCCIFTACKNSDKKESGGETSTVVVVDENGEPVTNENGETVTAVVDENGETVSSGDEAPVNIGDNTESSSIAQPKKGSKKTTKAASKNTTAAKKEKTVTKPAKPAAVTNLKATKVTKDSLTLTWKGVKCSGYEVAYKPASGSWKTVKDAMTSTTLPFAGLSSYSTYSFRVRAYNRNAAGKNASGWATVSVKTKADDKNNRKIKVTVKLPVDSNVEDTLRVYIGKTLVKEAKIRCNGKTYFFTTDKKYKGLVKVRAELKSHGVSSSVDTDKNSCTVDLTGIGIDSDYDDDAI